MANHFVLSFPVNLTLLSETLKEETITFFYELMNILIDEIKQ